jgi:MerR family Zn(II)-responsive transcriptional regulator of zntA
MKAIRIGTVSERTGFSVDAIRFYEKQGLLGRPRRSEGGFRLFSPGDIERLQFIRRLQRMGFSLSEIRELLGLQQEGGETCPQVRERLRAKVAAIGERIRQLAELESQLRESLEKCERRLEGGETGHGGPCPVLEEMASGVGDAH